MRKQGVKVGGAQMGRGGSVPKLDMASNGWTKKRGWLLIKQPRSEIFSRWAEALETRSKAPVDKDDGKWLMGVINQTTKQL